MSLRARLTALTAAIVAVVTSILGAIVAAAAARVQLEVLDRALMIRLPAALMRTLPADPEALSGFSPSSLAIGVVDDGQVAVVRPATGDSGYLPFPAVPAHDLRVTGVPFTVEGDPDYRVVTRTLGTGGLTVVLALPLAETQADVRRFNRGIALAVAGTTLIGAAGTWLVIRRSFRPMDQMVTAAREVAAGRLGTRVPAGQPGTEIGELSSALNTMISSLTDSLAQVASSEQRLRAFISDASHEIRTPLTVIRGYTELIATQVRDGQPVSQRALDRIESEGARLDRLVTALLTLERSQAAVTDPGDVDLAELVREHLSDLVVLGANRPVDIRVDPVALRGNEDAWRQVLSNLVQNIARYTPPDSPLVVALRQDAEAAVLTVDDAGPGIPPQSRQLVLDRYARVGSQSGGGFGLGLAVAAAVVRAHGGSLSLTDSPLGGLRVRIDVPVPAAGQGRQPNTDAGTGAGPAPPA